MLALLLCLTAADRPNVVVILADDLGIGDLGCYADRFGTEPGAATPHCDRLARGGALLTDFHSNAAVCTPTRYGLLTGRYAFRSYLKDWVLGETMPLLIEEGRPTLASAFAAAGYRTAAVGKWHLGWGRDNNAFQLGDLSVGPNAAGFDTHFVVPFSHNSTPSMQVFVRGGRVVGTDTNPVITDPDEANAGLRSLEDTATRLVDEACGFIAGNASRPFLLYLATTNVHFPVTPSGRFVTEAESRDLPAARLPRAKRLYPGFVREFDWTVGRVLEALDSAGVAEDTILLVTSDNGGAAQFGGRNGPYRGAKGQIYEGGHRVPMLVRWPGRVPAGRVVEETAVMTDVFPTLADACGIPLPENAAPDGVSTLPLLSGETESLPERPVVHHSNGGLFALRRGRWKLIDGLGTGQHGFRISLGERRPVPIRPDGTVEDWSFDPKPGPQPKPGEPAVQLFDMAADPYETTDLAADRPKVVAELRAVLDAVRTSPER